MSTAGIFGWSARIASSGRSQNENDDPEDNIDRMSDIDADGNRFTLGRVPFTNGPDLQPVMQNNGGLTAARLEGNSRGNLLTKALKDDPHIGPFVPRLSNGKMVGIPSKDNGLDVEGLAVSGDRAFLGLRGPVLRGWTVVLELQMADFSSGLFRLESLGTARHPLSKALLAAGRSWRSRSRDSREGSIYSCWPDDGP